MKVPFWIVAILGVIAIGGWIVFALLAHNTVSRYLSIAAAVLYVSAVVNIYFDRKKRRGSTERK
jgi:hypothetical protein